MAKIVWPPVNEAATYGVVSAAEGRANHDVSRMAELIPSPATGGAREDSNTALRPLAHAEGVSQPETGRVLHQSRCSLAGPD